MEASDYAIHNLHGYSSTKAIYPNDILKCLTPVFDRSVPFITRQTIKLCVPYEFYKIEHIDFLSYANLCAIYGTLIIPGGLALLFALG